LPTKTDKKYSLRPEGKAMSKHTGVRKLPNGRFRARFFAGYTSRGKRVYPARTFDTQREALDWLAEERPGRSGSAHGHKLTVAAFVDQWMATKHGLRSNSQRTYQSTIDSHIKPYLGSVRLNRLDAQQVDLWQADLLKQGLAKSTISSARNRLYAVCEKAVRMKLLKHNPVAATDGVGRGTSKRARHLTFEEAQQFIEACDRARFGVLFHLAIRTGLRAEELIGLTWEDMELTGARGALRVRRVVHHPPGGGWAWQEPKSENSKRRVLFPAEIAAKLIEHRRMQLEEKLKAGPLWRHNDLVFANRVGDPIRYCILRKHFKRVLEDAGLPQEIVTHKLRHFHVTLGLASGVDLKTVSREVGHARPSFTADHYGEVVDEMFETACDKREELLKRKSRR
jgi:integrase